MKENGKFSTKHLSWLYHDQKLFLQTKKKKILILYPVFFEMMLWLPIALI